VDYRKKIRQQERIDELLKENESQQKEKDDAELDLQQEVVLA